MEKRGRPGTFGIIKPVVTLPGQRLAPPASLADDEIETWRATVASMPSGWFDTCPFLLRCLVAHVANAQYLSLALAEVRSTKDRRKYQQEFAKLSALHARESTMISNLSQKLRLVPRAKYTMERSQNLKSDTPTTRPWEIRSGDPDPAA